MLFFHPCHTFLLPLQNKHGWCLQVFEVFMHILGAYDDMVAEHGSDLVGAAVTELHVHAKSVPLAQLQKLGLSTVRSDIHLSPAMTHYSCMLAESSGLLQS